MFMIKTKNTVMYFTHKEDAENYKDYLMNGLKVIRKTNRSYIFNSGDKLINTTIGNSKKQYTLITRTGRHIACDRLLKKYVALI